jgi:hypothetical protein
MLAPPLWTAISESWQVGQSDQDCVLKDTASRDDCYQQLRARATRHPAKGANAPETDPVSWRQDE